jgi:hypothetical protein
MAAITNPLVVNFASDINACMVQYAKLYEQVMRLDTVYNGSSVQAILTPTQNTDTIGDTQATKAMLLNAITRATEVKSLIGNGQIAKLQTILAYIEAFKAPAAV